MYGRIARVFGGAREFDARESTKERTSAGGMLSLSQSLSVRAPVNLRRESRASRGESRRKTISHAWGTRSRAAERANGPDERYYEEMAWGDGAVRTASEDGEAESCPLDLHDERASNFEAVMCVFKHLESTCFFFGFIGGHKNAMTIVLSAADTTAQLVELG